MPQFTAGSDIAGKACPFCHAPIQKGATVYVCDSCLTPHHLECWQTNAGCTTAGCMRASATSWQAPAPTPAPEPTPEPVPQPAPSPAPTPPGYQQSGYQQPGYAPPGYQQDYQQGYQQPYYPQQAYGYAGPISASDLGGWNWGAFVFNWIWGLNHKAYWTLLVFIPYLGIIIPFVAGAMGNKWAWESGRFHTVQEMKECQKVWGYWAIAWFILFLVILIIPALVSGPYSY